MKTYELLNINDEFNRLPLGKLTVAQRAALTRTICALSQARKPFDESLKEAREKLKPEGFDELAGKKSRTDEEETRYKALVDEYNEAVQAAIQPNLEAEATLTVAKPMTQEELLALADAAPEWTAGHIVYLQEALGVAGE